MGSPLLRCLDGNTVSLSSGNFRVTPVVWPLGESCCQKKGRLFLDIFLFFINVIGGADSTELNGLKVSHSRRGNSYWLPSFNCFLILVSSIISFSSSL